MKKLVLLLSCGFLFACGNKDEKVISGQIKVDFDAPAPTRKIEKVVPLETNSESLYGRFFRVRTTDTRIFVQDMQQILVFDANGKYLSKVDRVGHGPQEYININNFWSRREELYVVASEKKGVLVYSLGGDYLRTIPLDFAPEGVAVTEEYMAFKSAYNQEGTLIVTDRDGHKKFEMIAPVLAKTTISIPAVFPFTESEGKVYYFPDFSSSIYTVGPDTADVKQIRFDFGVHSIKPEYIATLGQENMMSKFKEDKIVRFPSFYPARNWWGVVFSLGDKEYTWYYNADTGKQHIVSGEGKREIKPIAATCGDMFVESVEAAEFLTNPKYAPWRDSVQVDENDNAVLIFYTIE